MTTVFGNPGSTEMPFFRNWPTDFRYVLALQEASAVAMADGFAQATERAAFVNVHSAAGLGNALGNVYTAFRNKSPVVVLAGQQHRSLFPTEPFLFAEQAAAFPQPYVKWSIEPARAQDVPAALERAYHLAMQAPRGPVFVSVPMDDWDAPMDIASGPDASNGRPGWAGRRVYGDPHPSEAALVELAGVLERARAPVLVVGPAVDAGGAWDEVVALAERTGAPVWASPRSPLASFPEHHPAFAGFLPFDRRGVHDTLAAHDVALVLGAPVFTLHLHAEGPLLPSTCETWQVTDDPGEAARAHGVHAIVGAVRPALRHLLAALPSADRPPARYSKTAAPTAPAPERPPTAGHALHLLARVFPEDTVVVEETPSHRHDLHQYLPIRAPRSFFTGASGGLGWAMPAAVGIQLAWPERQVVCLVGDGSSQYSPQALWTAARLGLPVLFVVMNNGGYGAMKGFAGIQEVAAGPSYDLPGIDIAALARSYGVAAVTARSVEELDRAIERATDLRAPMLIDVHLAAADPVFA